MHAHDGVFLEVTPGVRFVSTDVLVVDADGYYLAAGPFMVRCWAIAAEANGTRYTATARHWDEGAAKRHAEMDFAEGWGGCADQLGALCEAP